MSLPPYVQRTRDSAELPAFQPEMDRDLRVPLERQDQNQWCWAAVALGVAAHYAAPDASRWKRQCLFVNDFLQRNDSCGPAGSGPSCNLSQPISLALQKADHYRDYTDRIDFESFRNEIAGNRPVVLRIIRLEGGKTFKHFVVVDAFKKSNSRNGYVAVRNSDQPRRDILSYAALSSNGYEGWQWDYTFFTRPAEASERESRDDASKRRDATTV